jgi:DNA-binding transcriptional MerR regulator
MSESVSRLARRFGLARSTLLYYDRLGLLSPGARSAAGYREYSASDAKRLEAIVAYRRTGLGLADIRDLLDGKAPRRQILARRLAELDAELDGLREQQQVIRRLLARPELARAARLDKAGWVAILRASGLGDAAMRRWHIEFERRAPADHLAFLRSLGMARAEITRVRRWAR